ncbi:SseB family protein [Nocardia stercoris]|uniref:Uncharacterized protein n=1 Tax=Nocardia stercoris TaxID=2483361 RepID=A0A3M2L4Q5_9NOCA|nr:SseB family protein [Nocardia stercoris]RMI32649.1 hypothetical protein EBN03_11800 [Nocardia stercoris]
MDIVDSGPLRSEIAAFYSGFGQADVLRAAVRDSLLIVPITSDDRVWTSTVRGVRWMTAFTTLAEYAAFENARGVDADAVYRHHTVRGRWLVDYAEQRPDPTGVLVDIAGARPMAFPPRVDEAEGPAGV